LSGCAVGDEGQQGPRESFVLRAYAADAGKVIAFIILAFFSLFAWLFIYFLLPETNGLSINVNVENVLRGNINNKIK
jgi:hypothetical protein